MSPTYARTPISAPVRAAVLNGADCYYCGAPWPSEVDHVLPVGLGGTNRRDNLVAACHRCNAEKSDKTVAEWGQWRMSRNYPWPPPNLAEFPPDWMMAWWVATDSEPGDLDAYFGEALSRASRAEDAVFAAAINAHNNRVWRGTEDDSLTEVGRLLDALEHADSRIAEDRQRCIATITAIPGELNQAIAEAAEQLDIDRIKRGWSAARRRLAEAVADLVERHLNADECEQLEGLLANLDNWRTRRALVLDHRAFESMDQVAPETEAFIREHFARSIARFAEIATQDERDRLSALVDEVTS